MYEHGTNTSYQKGCRCSECREVHRATEHARRERIRAGKPPKVRRPYFHGTQTAYWQGCRCGKCRAAAAEYEKSRKQIIATEIAEQRKAIQRAIDEQVARMMQLAERIRA